MFFILAYLFALPALAQETARPTIYVQNPSQLTDVQSLLDQIILWITQIAGPVLTIIFIIGAFQMLTARDNETQFTKGKKTITRAAIGMAVLLVANGIFLVVQSILTP